MPPIKTRSARMSMVQQELVFSNLARKAQAMTTGAALLDGYRDRPKGC